MSLLRLHAGGMQNYTGRYASKPGQLDEFTYVTIDLSTMKFDRVKEQCSVPPSFYDLK